MAALAPRKAPVGARGAPFGRVGRMPSLQGPSLLQRTVTCRAASKKLAVRHNGGVTIGLWAVADVLEFLLAAGAYRGGNGAGGAVPERGAGAVSECGAGDCGLRARGQHVRVLQRRDELHGTAFQRLRPQSRRAEDQPALCGCMEPDAHRAAGGGRADAAGGVSGGDNLRHRRGAHRSNPALSGADASSPARHRPANVLGGNAGAGASHGLGDGAQCRLLARHHRRAGGGLQCRPRCGVRAGGRADLRRALALGPRAPRRGQALPQSREAGTRGRHLARTGALLPARDHHRLHVRHQPPGAPTPSSAGRRTASPASRP